MEADRLGASQGVKVKVVVDTNFLLMMAQGVIAPSSLNDAINASYELVTTDAVVKELETMSKREDLLAREAEFALKLLERLGVQVLRVKAGNADESILTLAKELVQNGDRVVVATNDKNLRRSVRRLGVPTLYLREEGLRLEIDWNPLL
ncbi:MAG: PIN domain-containing protein [Acidilobus sp.]